MRRTLFEGLTRSPLTEPPPSADDAALAELAANVDRAARRRLGRSLSIRRSRCRLLQRLRAGNPRAQQRVLRPRTLRPALRRLAAPRRRAAGDRPGHQEHARGAGAHLQCDAGSEMGRRGRRLRRGRRHIRRQLRGGRRRQRSVVPVDLHIRGCPPRPLDLLKGLLALLEWQSGGGPGRRATAL